MVHLYTVFTVLIDVISYNFSISGVNTGGVGSYIYDEPVAEAQP